MSVMAETESLTLTLEAALMDLKKLLGYELQLKPGQREAIVHLLNGRDVLCVLPTGYGKSLIYQMFTLAKVKAISVSNLCPLETAFVNDGWKPRITKIPQILPVNQSVKMQC